MDLALGRASVSAGRSVTFWTSTRLVAAAAIAAGLFVAVAVIGYFDVGAVLAAVRPIGVGGFVAVVMFQAALSLPLGLAWWTVAARPSARRLRAFVWASLAAEAAATVLPFSQLGGAAAASRVAVLGGVPASVALGSNMVDITVELAAEVVWTVNGVIFLADHLRAHAVTSTLLPDTLYGVVAGVGLLGGVLAAQRWGLPLIEFVARRLGSDEAAATAVRRVIRALYRRRRRVEIGFGLHLAAWSLTAVQAWLILVLIGRPLPIASVFAMESLMFAVRNAAFFVPGGLGVQEGAYAILGPLFGLPPEAALALSLIKRARDVAIGVPVLLSWQLAEIRRPLRKARAAAGV